MIVYIFRHGEAETKAESPTKTDEGRRITADGAEQVKRVCRIAKQLNAEPNTILTSPLIRAKQTGEITKELLNPTAELKVEASLEPDREPEEVYTALSKFKRSDNVMLVTHIPILGRLIFDLLGGHVNLEMNNGALAKIESKSLPKSGSGTLMWLLPQS